MRALTDDVVETAATSMPATRGRRSSGWVAVALAAVSIGALAVAVLLLRDIDGVAPDEASLTSIEDTGGADSSPRAAASNVESHAEGPSPAEPSAEAAAPAPDSGGQAAAAPAAPVPPGVRHRERFTELQARHEHNAGAAPSARPDRPSQPQRTAPEAPAPRPFATSPRLQLSPEAATRISVAVAEIDAPSTGGWLVVYASDQGRTGQQLGQLQVEGGLQRDLVVGLQRQVPDGAGLWVVLHHRLPADDGAEPGPPVSDDGVAVRSYAEVSSR